MLDRSFRLFERYQSHRPIAAESGDSENPPLDLRCPSLVLRQKGIQMGRKGTVTLGLAHPSGDCVRVTLVGITIPLRKRMAPESRINFDHG